MEKCVVLLIGNNGEGVELACACVKRLSYVLKQEVCGHPVCGDPILLLDKSKEEIMQGIREAVQLVKDRGASWLIIYYAGHSFWDKDTQEIYIDPKADGHEMRLEKQVKLTVRNAELEWIQTSIFMDSCLDEDAAEDEADDDYQLGDSKKLQGNVFLPVTSCEIGESVRDGCLFALAIERCAQKPLVDQLSLMSHVEELAWQLSFRRLCPRRSGKPGLNGIKDMVLTVKQRELFRDFHFLRFALDLWTEDELELDPQTGYPLKPDGSDIDKTVKILQSIVKELETKKAAFEDPWCELEAIAHSGSSLKGFLKYLQRLEIPVRHRDDSSRPTLGLIPQNVRRAIVDVFQEKIRDPDFQWGQEQKLRCLVQKIGEWYETWQPRNPPKTGTCILHELEGPLQEWPKFTYSLVVEDLDVKNLQESERKRVAEQINQLWKDLDIPGHLYLVPGSLWIIFCLNDGLSRDCRREFAASLKSWIDQQKQNGASGWTLARDPCWKPLHAVPDRILESVRQVETLCATCLPTRPMWLRASDLRNLVAETIRERKLEEWRVVVFEGLMERRGDSWLQGTGTLGCCFLPHFEDERLDHRMQEVANLACKRKQSMRPEVQALVFLLQRAQLELTDEEWTQVVDSARVCYQHLKTVLHKVVMGDKDTDLICEMNDIVEDSDWELVDSGPVKDSENPSGSNGRDAAAAATAANNSSGSDDQVAVHVEALQKGIPEGSVEADRAEAKECRDIWNAAGRGKVGAVRHFLREDPDAVHERTRFGGREPLHMAAMHGHVDVVQVLLGAKASVDAKESEFGHTPLQNAASQGHDATVERLLAAGANVNALTNEGHTPLQDAASQGHDATVERLLAAGANVDAVNNKGMTPHQMAKEGHEMELGWLNSAPVEQFCNECEKCDAEDASPHTSWELCALMTEAAGISVDTAGRCFMKETIFKAAFGGCVSGQDLRKGSQILATDGSIVEVTHLELSEKRGKVVLQTEKAKLEVAADQRVVNVTHEGAQRQVPAFTLSVGDLVMVDNQTESLRHVDFDPATFNVWKIRFYPDKTVEAFSLQPTIQIGHKIAKRCRGGRTRAVSDDSSVHRVPDTQEPQGYYSD